MKKPVMKKPVMKKPVMKKRRLLQKTKAKTLPRLSLRKKAKRMARAKRTARSPSPRQVRLLPSRRNIVDSTDRIDFDFCGEMRDLCEDISRRVPELSHVVMRDVLVCITRSRSGGRTGLWAKLTPLRFEGGARLGMRRGQRYVIEPLVVDGREQLYILTFCLPRFLNLTYREKLVTVFHELFHIGPHFDGDHRRFAGRYHMHSPRAELFDSEAERLCDLYLATSPAPFACRFLRHRCPTLLARHGAITGLTIPVPKLIPVDEAA